MNKFELTMDENNTLIEVGWIDNEQCFIHNNELYIKYSTQSPHYNCTKMLTGGQYQIPFSTMVIPVDIEIKGRTIKLKHPNKKENSKMTFREIFKKSTNCNTYDIDISHMHMEAHTLRSLLDHGFITDQASIWGKNIGLTEHEIVIISQTYADDDIIDNPPDGINCVRLPSKLIPTDTPKTTIAISITSNTTNANDLLTTCVTSLPTYLFPYILPKNMTDEGYGVILKTYPEHNTVIPKITR